MNTAGRRGLLLAVLGGWLIMRGTGDRAQAAAMRTAAERALEAAQAATHLASPAAPAGAVVTRGSAVSAAANVPDPRRPAHR